MCNAVEIGTSLYEKSRRGSIKKKCKQVVIVVGIEMNESSQI